MVTSRLNLSRNAARQSTGRGRSFEPCCETIGTWRQKSSRPWDPRHAKLESCHRKRFDRVSGEEGEVLRNLSHTFECVEAECVTESEN